MRYVRCASPLHAARAAAGGLWCCALAFAALTAEHPVVLGALALGVMVAAVLAGVGRPVVKLACWLLPWALVVAVINVLVVRQGLTVIARLGEVPPFGQVDLTLEGLVFGLMFGLRLLTVALVFAVFSSAVDPDDLLRGLRRMSLRSALAATLATRLVPVLAADARRIDEARRCRADGGGTGAGARVAVLRAVASNALDRALDVAATLEVRGYATAHPHRGQTRSVAFSAISAKRNGTGLTPGWGRTRRGGRPWSRHDLAFTASAVTVAALATAARLQDVAHFGAYPQLAADPVGQALALAAVLLLAALAPFANRRGIVP